jgi:transketolase
MRQAFIRALIDAAATDERIHLVVGDLGFAVVEPFVQKFPNRYLNVGVAEQNMTGIAAGMALCGKVVFTYSIANFPTLRCLEQIRNDVCYHNADVKIVSVGGGLGYGALGMTHHATEDIAIMRALPRTVVVAPGDPIEAGLATHAIARQKGPCYLRLGKSGEPRVHQPEVDFRLGKAITVREGDDICLIVTGSMLYAAVQVADRLSHEGVRARVLSMHTVKPLDVPSVLAAARETSAIFTLEEHSITGGLGSAVAEVLAESGEARIPFKRLGLPPDFTSQTGDHDYLKKAYGLSIEGVLRSLESIFQQVRSAK